MKKLLAALLLSTVPVSAFAAPKVVVSIFPLHSLVAGVMEGVGSPELLMKGVNSEHSGSYSPQQISDLGHADVVFIIGDNLEVKLGEISGTETVNGKKFVKLDQAANIVKHSIREGGNWEIDADKPASANTVDPHIWLDPENAKVMTKAIAAALVLTDPANAKAYNNNMAKQVEGVDQLEAEIKSALTGVNHKPFIVFHDAYQYFESRFRLSAAGSIVDYSAAAASAKRLDEIRTKIINSKAACVFKEPQFSDASVKVVTEGSPAKIGVLDPLGAGLTPGKDAYGLLLRNLAKNLSECLGR